MEASSKLMNAKTIRTILITVAATLLVVLLLQNTGATRVRFLIWELQMPLFAVIGLTATLGAAVGAMVYRKLGRR
jgi:uncharacterized integral membrane protein